MEASQDVNELQAKITSLGMTFEIEKMPKLDDFSTISENFHPHTPIVHIIQNCNSPCRMCDCWKTKEKTWHSAEKLKYFFTEIKKKGAIAIMLSGGEPLLHPELSQIISDLKELELKIVLNSNGLLLHRHKWLADWQIDQLVVSMDGLNESEYKYIRGLNGYHTVWNNLETFQKASPTTLVGIRTILNKYNYKNIDHFYDAIEMRGMHSVGLSPADIDSISFARQEMNDERSTNLKSLLIPSINEIEAFLQGFTPEDEYYQKIEKAYLKGLSSWQPREFIQCMHFYLAIQLGEKNQFSNRPCFFPYLIIS
jgi:MoaA/NifB/PqqE/SkfB family radical SAM enzyme